MRILGLPVQSSERRRSRASQRSSRSRAFTTTHPNHQLRPTRPPQHLDDHKHHDPDRLGRHPALTGSALAANNTRRLTRARARSGARPGDLALGDQQHPELPTADVGHNQPGRRWRNVRARTKAGLRPREAAHLLLANCASLEPVRKRLGICDARRSTVDGRFRRAGIKAAGLRCRSSGERGHQPISCSGRVVVAEYKLVGLPARGGSVADVPACACVCRQAGDGFNRVGRAERASVSVSRRSVPSNQGLLLG